MITFKLWEKAILSDADGLERGCDLVPHIIIPLCVSFVFFCEFQTQNQPLRGNKPCNIFSWMIVTSLTLITRGI